MRPNLDELIQRGVYPATDARVSPVLAQRCKNLEREKVKNMLEQQLKGRVWIRFRNILLKTNLANKETQQSVRDLVARFTPRKRDADGLSSKLHSDPTRKWNDVETPTRAKVYRLRMFFERLSRSQKQVVVQ